VPQVQRGPIENLFTMAQASMVVDRIGESRGFDVTTNGMSFLAAATPSDQGSADALRRQVRIVLNWFEELKRLVPTE